MSNPIISSFSPTTQTPGKKVTITGSGFTGATAVQFGGIDAMLFIVVSDTQIDAYPAIAGTGTITVITAAGTTTVTGFTIIKVKVQVPDLPALGRAISSTDLLMVWDSVKNVLCKATGDELPAGTGGGTGSGTTGNIYTALGSPFYVTTADATYTYANGVTTVTDVRLIGKSGYLVQSTQLQNIFRQSELTFDSVNGVLTIPNFQLQDGEELWITCDGVVNNAIQDYLNSIKDKVAVYDKVVAPVISTGGIVWPWRKSAASIPAGWQECTDFRGKIVIGQDPNDDVLKASQGSLVGGASWAKFTVANNNIQKVNLTLPATTNGQPANGRPGGTSFQWWGDGTANIQLGVDNPDGIDRLGPARIVNWIEYVG